MAAGRGRDAEPSTRTLPARCCKCGSPTSWSSRSRRSTWYAPAPASPKAAAEKEPTEAQIYTFIPAVGGAGVTTLAMQTAMVLLNSGGPRARPSTCLVDLDFQHGAVADYLDLEPRLNLAEIEPRPDRLDRQLLEVMLSYHASGLAVVAAPNRPAEMRSFDPDVVTRLLDLVSSNFEYVVFDMPRTWFSWTDSVLLGSNKLFIVSETTVPGLRHAKQLVAAIKERLGDGPKPEVIVNRFAQRMFVPACAAAISRRRLAMRSSAPSPMTMRWCARQSTAACRSKRSSPATRSRRKSRGWCWSAVQAAAEGEPVPLLKKFKLAVAGGGDGRPVFRPTCCCARVAGR